MKVIDRTLHKALDPWLIASELNLIACKHRCSGNEVERGAFGIVKVIFTNGEAHYTPSNRGIELSILKYDEQDCCKPRMKNVRK
jgi:hypothetical protein